MGEAFVDHELIRLGRHRVAVETVETPKGGCVFNRDALEGAAYFDWRGGSVDLEHHIWSQGQGDWRLFHVKQSFRQERCRR